MDILSEIRRIQLVLTFKIHEELCFENTQLLKYKEFCYCSWVCSDGAAPWLYEHKVHCLIKPATRESLHSEEESHTVFLSQVKYFCSVSTGHSQYFLYCESTLYQALTTILLQ